MGTQPRTVAIDFDGVIHKYSKGWHDGTCYDEPVPGVFEALQELFRQGYSIFIFSTRKPRHIKHWLKQRAYDSEYVVDGMGGDPQDFCYPKYGFTVEVIPFWKKFWNKKDVVGITRRKLPAHCYIDDRAVKFEGDWKETLSDIFFFKTYTEKNANR